jgi:hypothetical protein
MSFRNLPGNQALDEGKEERISQAKHSLSHMRDGNDLRKPQADNNGRDA